MKPLIPCRSAVFDALRHRLNITPKEILLVLRRYGVRVNGGYIPFTTYDAMSEQEREEAFLAGVQLIEKRAKKNELCAKEAKRYLLPYHRAQKIDSLLNE